MPLGKGVVICCCFVFWFGGGGGWNSGKIYGFSKGVSTVLRIAREIVIDM